MKRAGRPGVREAVGPEAVRLRGQLVRRAVAAGYSEDHARNVINKILREAGLRRRNRDAGSKVRVPGEISNWLKSVAVRANTRGKSAAAAGTRGLFAGLWRPCWQ